MDNERVAMEWHFVGSSLEYREAVAMASAHALKVGRVCALMRFDEKRWIVRVQPEQKTPRDWAGPQPDDPEPLDYDTLEAQKRIAEDRADFAHYAPFWSDDEPEFRKPQE